METIEYTTVEKSDWGPGLWQDEPDKRQWSDEDTGLPCLMVRNQSGALCGYVGISEGHPCFGSDYDNAKPVTVIDDPGDEYYGEWIDVHGGLTFAGFCADTTDESKHICHKPSPSEPEKVWWLGFDCAHSGDLCPSYASKYPRTGNYDTYKSLAYVISQCAKLAKQLVSSDSAGRET